MKLQPIGIETNLIKQKQLGMIACQYLLNRFVGGPCIHEMGMIACQQLLNTFVGGPCIHDL